MGNFDLLPGVVEGWFGHELIVPPPVGESQLPVDEVVGGSQPVADVDALGAQVVAQVVGVLDVLEVHHDVGVAFGGRGEVVLVQEGPEGVGVLDPRVGEEGRLLALPVDLEHHVVAPLVVGERRRQLVVQPRQLPVDVALLPHPVHVLRHHPAPPPPVHLQRPQRQQPVGEAETQEGAEHARVEAVGPRFGGVQLALESQQEEAEEGLVGGRFEFALDPLAQHFNISIISNPHIQAMTEKHLIKITVEVRSVYLLVRFPCKLTLHLKTDSKQVDSRPYDLKRGECHLNQTLELETEVAFDTLTGHYEDRQVRLVVQMNSNNGVIPAGSVSFNPTNKEELERVDYTLPLEKCPDRNAQISFLQFFQLLRKTSGSQIYQSQYNERTARMQRPELKKSSSNLYIKSHLQKSREGRDGSRKELTGPSNRSVSPKMRVKTSESFLASADYRHRHHATEEAEQYMEMGESQVVREEIFQQPHYMTQTFMNPHEKSQMMKEIARLKGELKGMQSEDRLHQLQRCRQENELILGELDKLRERVRGMERKEREHNLQLKEAKEEAERNKNKCLQMEAAKNESELALAERERVGKQAQLEISKLNERISDLNGQVSNQQKRMDFKEQSSQEQLRKMNQRYSQSEAERQKLTFQHNGLLLKLEESERKHQTVTKERERSIAEERSRLNKRVEQLSQELDRLRDDNADKQLQLSEAISQLSALKKSESEKEERLNICETELETTKLVLRKEQESSRNLQKEIASLKSVEEQRSQLRRKINDANVDLAKISERNARQQAEAGHYEFKIKQLESSLSDRTKERDLLQSKHNNLKKEVESSHKEQERLQREVESLSVINVTSTQKLNDIHSKMESQRREHEEGKMLYESQLNYLVKSKEYVDHEIEEIKWSLEKNKEENIEVSSRLKAANQEILRLNQLVLSSEERAKKGEERLRELEADLNGQIKAGLELQEKERSLNEQIRVKNEQIYELQKKVQAADSNIFVLNEKMKQAEINAEERRSQDERTIKEKEKLLAAKSEENSRMQLQIFSLKEQLSSSGQEVASRSSDLIYLKESIQTAKQDLANKDVKLNEVREEAKQITLKLEAVTKQCQNLKKSGEQERKVAVRCKKELEEYRRETSKALEQLIGEVSKEDDCNISRSSLLSFPDATISAMQVEFIKKRTQMQAKHQALLAEKTEEKIALESELRKIKAAFLEKEAELEAIIKLEREKNKQTISSLESAKEELEKLLAVSEEKQLQLTGEIEKTANYIKKEDDFIDELQTEIAELTEQRENLRNELKTAEEQILVFKSNEIKLQASNDSKISQISGQNDSIIEKMKTNITELQRKISIYEKMLKEKEEAIKKMESRLNQGTLEKERAQSKVSEAQERLAMSAEEKKDMERKIKTLEKELKESSIQLQKSKVAQNNEKLKMVEVQSKLNEAYDSLSDSQVQNEKLKSQLIAISESSQHLQEALKDKENKFKLWQEKQSQEVRQMKEKIIEMNSALELREFQVKQQQTQIDSLTQQLNEAKEELGKKKTQGLKVTEELQTVSNQLMYSTQNMEIVKSEKQFLENENQRLRERSMILEEELGLAQFQIENLDLKEKEILSLREELEATKFEKEKLNIEMKNSMSRLTVFKSNPMMNSSRMGPSIDEKRRIRELEQLLETKNYDFATARKKLLNEYEKEKRQLVAEIEKLSGEIENLQSEFDFQRSQMQQEIQSLSEEVERYRGMTEIRKEGSIHQKLFNSIDLERSLERATK